MDAPSVVSVDPVDLADLRQAAQRVRELEHVLADGRVTIALCYPTRHERQRLIALHLGPGGDRVRDLVAAERALVAASIRGWRGVTVADALPGHKRGGERLTYTPEAVELVLDEQVEWRGALAAALSRAWSARDAEIEAAAGNSRGASSGSAPADAPTPTVNSDPSVSVG